MPSETWHQVNSTYRDAVYLLSSNILVARWHHSRTSEPSALAALWDFYSHTLRRASILSQRSLALRPWPPVTRYLCGCWC